MANEIPEKVIIEGKVPSAWFLEQVGAKGMRVGDIHVADYHANLIYNAGSGTARDLVAIIAELKQRVERRWGIPLEEEVQYVGEFKGIVMRLTAFPVSSSACAASLAFAADVPSGESLMQRYIDKSGGERAYAKAKSMSMSGKVEMEGRNISGTVTIIEEGREIVYRDGIPRHRQGRRRLRRRDRMGRQRASGAAYSGGRRKSRGQTSRHSRVITSWREVFTEAKTVGTADVDGKPAWRVEMTPKEGKPETYFFDRDSGLLVKTSAVLSTAMGDIATEATMSDFRSVDGILTPFAITEKAMSQSIVMHFDKIAYNAAIPPGRFDPPDSVKSLRTKGK